MSCVRIGIVALGLLLAAQTAPALASTCVWTGLAANNRWSSADNWINCAGGAPRSGDSIVFPQGASRPVNHNDLTSLSLAELRIEGVGEANTRYYITSAQPVTVTSLFRLNAPAVLTAGPTFDAALRLGGPVRIQAMHPNGGIIGIGPVNLNGHGLTVDVWGSETEILLGAISGSGSLLKTGPGWLRLSTGTFSGPTLVSEGHLVAGSATALGVAGDSNGTFVAETAALWLGSVGTNMTVAEPITLNGGGPLGSGILNVRGNVVLTGPMTLTRSIALFVHGTLRITGKVTAADPIYTLSAYGEGRLAFANPGNSFGRLYAGTSVVQVETAGALPSGTVVDIGNSTLEIGSFDQTIGPLGIYNNNAAVLLNGGTLTSTGGDSALLRVWLGTIKGTGNFVKGGAYTLRMESSKPNTLTGTMTVTGGTLELSNVAGVTALPGPVVVSGGTLRQSQPHLIADHALVTVSGTGRWVLQDGVEEAIDRLAGDGVVQFTAATSAFPRLSLRTDASTTFAGALSGPGLLAKYGAGTLTLPGNHPNFSGHLGVYAGSLQVNGQIPNGSVAAYVGLVGGGGSVGMLTADGTGLVAPGSSPGVLSAGRAYLNGVLDIELAGPDPGSGYDQLRVSGELRMDGLSGLPRLQVSRSFTPRAGASFTIVSTGAPIVGTFDGLEEGATLELDGQTFRITYRGGIGHDIVLTALNEPTRTYYLSEGATGDFFDADILIANPNEEEAPVVVRFFTEDGRQIDVTRTLGPKAHTAIHVDEQPGLEATTVSAQITSTRGLPLIVERSMFWDRRYYAGHTGSAVDAPSTDWFFAEGAQGFFDTFLLIVNPGEAKADVTFTFLREDGAPIVHTVGVAGGSRYTLGAAELSDLHGRSFGVSIQATRPIMAERAMYFGSLPGRQWGGGHESAGVTRASTRWLFAEGATGDFFDTFILLSNPQDAPAQVTMQFLLPSGEAIEVPKTIEPHARLTVNPETEADARLHGSAVSTVVRADRPIVAERSMYWRGVTFPWGESHNSFGVTEAATRWGLAEGRLGGRVPFATYILLANPQAAQAEVTVSFLRASGPPVVKRYTVAPTSRFNLDVAEIAELQGSLFGALIEVTNNVPIFVERSMYWSVEGVFWSGGTNAMGIRLP